MQGGRRARDLAARTVRVAGSALRAGAFAAARKLNVDYVPVGIAYPAGCEFVEPSFVEHVAAVAKRPRTPAAMAVGAPLRIDGRANEVAERLHAEVQTLVGRARAALTR